MRIPHPATVTRPGGRPCAGSMGPEADACRWSRCWLRSFIVGHGKSVATRQGVKSNSNHRTTNEPRINDRIRAREVRLVDPDGEQLGIKLLPEALAIARDLDLDLVEVAPGPTLRSVASWTSASSSSTRPSGPRSRGARPST